MCNDFKLAGLTLTGKEYNLNTAFDSYILMKSLVLWDFLIALGYDEDAIIGIATGIAIAWKCIGRRGWINGESGTISFVLELLDTNDRSELNATIDRNVAITVAALFCFDRAIVTNSRNRVQVAANWLESADELYFYSSRPYNLTEKHILSERASNAAFARHKETYELKNQAMDYWRSNIDHGLSNDKAAELLIKVVPLSHRKLSQYVAEAKRKRIPPAS